MTTWDIILINVGFLAVTLLLKRLLRTLKNRVLGKRQIPVVPINGVIQFSSEADSAYQVLEDRLRRVDETGAKAMILRINSPGGTVGASQAIYSTLQKLRSKGVKIIAVMEDVAASGGLYIAMGADQIIAQPGTITGSIGVIMGGIEYSEILDALHIGVQIIKSGDYKDIGSSMRKMKDDERNLLQTMVLNVHAQFCYIIAKARDLSLESVLSFADGRVFTGMQAHELKLIDQLGGIHAALTLAEASIGLKEGSARPFYFSSKRPLLKRLGFKSSMISMAEQLAELHAVSNLPLWILPKR